MLTLSFAFPATLMLFVGADTLREAISKRRLRRARLRTVFTRFIEENRTASVGEVRTEQFLLDTAEAESLFRRGSVPQLRLELHDQALRLSRLDVAVAESWVGPAREGALVEGCLEIRAWFERAAASVDACFDDANSTLSDLRDICSEILERFNRIIRA